MYAPTLLDLFSGIGGFSLGFERAGFKTIGFSEIDPYACSVLRKHWPDVPNYGDLRLIPTLSVDVITGGFPCQPFSLAGKRGGSSDDRWLWPAMYDVIIRCQPSWVLGENVPGIIGLELDRVLSDLENIGYTAWPIVIPACAVDAPHRRDRVWIVAHAGGRGREQRGTEWSGKVGTGTCNEPCQPSKDTLLMANSQSSQSRISTKRESRKDIARGSIDYGGNQTERGKAMADARCTPRSSRRAIIQGCNEKDADRQTTRIKGQGSDRKWFRWPTEPAVGRVANGIPARVDRLKCLGNAIVPQIAQIFAQAIYQQLMNYA